MITTAPLLSGSILDEEIALETRAIEDGVARYRRLADEAVSRGDGASLKPAERMLLHWYEPTKMLVVDKVESIKTKQCRDANVGDWGKFMETLSPERLAVAALHEALSRCMAKPQGVPVAAITYAIGSAVVAEIGVDGMKKDHRDDYETLMRKYRTLRPIHANRYIKKKVTDEHWNRSICAHLGATLLHIVMTAALASDYDAEELIPAFEIEQRRRGRKTHNTLHLSPLVFQEIDRGHELRKFLRPRYLPMIVPPYPWQTVKDEEGKHTIEGGYATIRAPYISKPTREQKAALAAADLGLVNECRSAVESTPWRVNRRVAAIQRALYEAGGGVLDIPRLDEVPMPPHPAGFNGDAEPGKRWSNVDAEARAQWKKDAKRVIRRNIQEMSERENYARTLDVTRMFEGRSEFYLPHQFDFRGRIYALPPHLNHQQGDVVRGLMEFASSKPVDSDESLRELLVEASNNYGIDKVSYDQRAEWARDNFKNIERAARDPLGDEWWRRAKKPWQFLAACFALTDPEAAAHAPVRRDGSCNGLQHYAALSRDEAAAAVVNLLPGDRPADVYGDVARAILPTVQSDAVSSERVVSFHDFRTKGKIEIPVRHIAGVVADMVTREGCKQPVMTTVYGVTAKGAKRQVMGYLKERGLKDETLYAAGQYLANTIIDGIGVVCAGARGIMDWLRECAHTIADRGHLVGWTSPLGFPVLQPYRHWPKIQIKTLVGHITLRVQEDWVPINVHKHVNACAPDFVHSIDASHLLMTARACRAADTTFAAVHDQYWSHAADRRRQDRILREQFVALHQRPLLEDLLAQWRTRHPDLAFEEPPPKGQLDIRQVLDSPYFFG